VTRLHVQVTATERDEDRRFLRGFRCQNYSATCDAYQWEDLETVNFHSAKCNATWLASLISFLRLPPNPGSVSYSQNHPPSVAIC
jgi:hypothetical protein